MIIDDVYSSQKNGMGNVLTESVHSRPTKESRAVTYVEKNTHCYTQNGFRMSVFPKII